MATTSNIYNYFCVEDKKFMVVFSTLIQYFRYSRPPFIPGWYWRNFFIFSIYVWYGHEVSVIVVLTPIQQFFSYNMARTS